MAELHPPYPVDPNLCAWGSTALKVLVDELRGHGGYTPLTGCGLCGIKDTAREILERRGDA